MDTQNFIEEAISRMHKKFGTYGLPQSEIHMNADYMRSYLTTELQSFARKVVEEGQKMNDEYTYKHGYPTAPLLELLDRVRSLSGLSGEDNPPKE